MRFISLFSILFTSLILAGCVSTTTRQLVLEGKSLAHEGESNGSCKIENVVQNLQKREITDRPGLNPDSISILNWNIYKGQHENWAADFRRYSYKHDLVIIQEARLGDELKSILVTEHPYWALNAAYYFQDMATGVMTVSRVKPIYSCGQRIAEPIIRIPKTSLISYYPVEGMDKSLLVANIHGINFIFGVDAYKEQIENLYSVIKHHAGPVILAGDFNTWSDERMQIVDKLVQRLTLQSLDYTNHDRASFLGNALDHVFYRGLEPVEHLTWHVTSSDHYPTHARFRVKHES